MAEMTPRHGARVGSIVFAVVIVTAIAMLTGLGIWQVQRAQWKTVLLAELDAREAATPLDIADTDGLDPADIRYRRMIATGTVVPRIARMHHVQDGKLGYKAVLPLVLEGSKSVVLLDAGFVAAEMSGPSDVDAPPGAVDVTGYARFHDDRPSRFTPDNAPDENRWFWWDMPALADALGLDAADLHLEAIQLSAPIAGLTIGGATPVPTISLPRPHNRHGGYAVTWFGLALAVAGAFAAWVWQRRGRQAVNPPQSGA